MWGGGNGNGASQMERKTPKHPSHPPPSNLAGIAADGLLELVNSLALVIFLVVPSDEVVDLLEFPADLLLLLPTAHLLGEGLLLATLDLLLRAGTVLEFGLQTTHLAAFAGLLLDLFLFQKKRHPCQTMPEIFS